MADDTNTTLASTAKATPLAGAPPAGGAVIPRDSLERVLARAMELQTLSEDGPESVSEARLAEIAREVGIDVSNLRQAMAEERARMPLTEENGGFLLDAFGPARMTAQRTVPGTPAEITAKLDAWMSRMEMLSLHRRIGDRISWEPRRDFLGNILRGMGIGGRQLDLARADQVAVMVTAIDDKRSVVHFDAELHGVRRTQRNVFVILSILLLKAFLIVSIPLWLLATQGPITAGAIALIGAVLGGTGVGLWRAMRRGYRRLAGRAQLRLEQLLDDLEQGGMNTRPGLLGQVRELMLGSSQRP